MPFQQSHNIEYFYFDLLRDAGLAHGIFARRGGVSQSHWGSLNTGSRVGDDPDHVIENLSRAVNSLFRSPESLVSVRQVHGNDVFVAKHLPPPDSLKARFGDFDSPKAASIPAADAVISENSDLTLFMRFADCVPIILFDPEKKIVGIAHAGWQGTVLKVAARAVQSMTENFGVDPADIIAGIGPSICVDHYEVGTAVLEKASIAFGDDYDRVIRQTNNRHYFDLWEANRLTLAQSGVMQIENAAECTVETPARWFSHRGEKGKTGRFVAMAGL